MVPQTSYTGVTRTVRDVMTRSPICCSPDTALPEVARLMLTFDCGQIPVVEWQTQRPIGVITDRDIALRVVAEGKVPTDVSARDCMTSPVVTVTPDASIEECCLTMELHQIRRVPVVDADGACCGIVSQADLARRLPNGAAAQVVHDVSRPGSPPWPEDDATASR